MTTLGLALLSCKQVDIVTGLAMSNFHPTATSPEILFCATDWVHLCDGLRDHTIRTSAKFLGFLTPSPPCPHFGLIHSSKYTQPPLVCLLLGYPPPPSRCGRPLCMAPELVAFRSSHVSSSSFAIPFHLQLVQQHKLDPSLWESSCDENTVHPDHYYALYRVSCCKL